MISFQPAFLQQFLHIPERQRIPQVPADGAENRDRLCLSPLENRRSGCHCGLHSAYQPVPFTSCNTTAGPMEQRRQSSTLQGKRTVGERKAGPSCSPLFDSALLREESFVPSSNPAAWRLIKPLNRRGLKSSNCSGKCLYFYGRIIQPNDVVRIGLSSPPC